MTTSTRGFPSRLAQTLAPKERDSDTLKQLVAAVDGDDTYMGGHAERVAALAAVLARLTGSSADEAAFVRRAAWMHDVGKIALPAQLVTKRDLTDEERHMVQLHPIMGASVLSRLGGLERFIPIVLHHHEDWNGGGYPSGSAQVGIPFESRIIRIADAYDRMTRRAPHGRGLGVEDALGELRKHAGAAYDPLLVDAMHEAYRHGALDRRDGPIVLPGGGWSMML